MPLQMNISRNSKDKTKYLRPGTAEGLGLFAFLTYWEGLQSSGVFFIGRVLCERYPVLSHDALS